MIRINHPSYELSLQLLAIEHAKPLFELIDTNRLYLRQRLSWIDKTQSVADTESFIAHCCKNYAERKSLTFGIWHSHTIIGIVGFHEIDMVSQTSSIGYWLSEHYQGNGIMTSAVEALVNYAIENFGITRVIIRVATNNEKSKHIPERLGFELCAIKKDGEIVNEVSLDQYVFQITDDKWKSLHSSGRLLKR